MQPMLTAAHTVLLGENADAQACVAAALPPMALSRLRRTCRSAKYCQGRRGRAPPKLLSSCPLKLLTCLRHGSNAIPVSALCCQVHGALAFFR